MIEGNGQPKYLVSREELEKLPDALRKSVLEYEVYKLNMGLMQQVVGQMKEIPILPSEVLLENDRNTLVKVEFPESGGILTYMENYTLPYRGFPYFELVEKIDVIKKIGKASISGLYHSLKRRRLSLIFLLPALFVFRDIFIAGIYTFYRIIERFKVKPIRLSDATRDLHRAFNEVETDLKELQPMLRDLICNVLEFDNAYRFRAQDLIELIDQKQIKKNPIKELNRILGVAQSRETSQEGSDTWKLAKLFVSFYLRFDRKLLKFFSDVIASINVEKFKLTPEDKQFCEKRKDWVFGFMKC